MRRDEIIDPEDSAIDTRFRRIVSLVAPFLGIIAIVAVIGAISVHSYRVTRERVLNLSQNLLNEQQKLLTREVSDYLGPAPQSATIAKDLLTEPLSDAPPVTFLNFGRALLAHLPQIDSLFIADDQGQFWFIDHAPPEISDGVEWVHFVQGQNVFRHWYYNRSGKLVRHRDMPGKNYDPRTKDWYLNAVHHPEIAWTNPYPSKFRKEIFSTASSLLTSTTGHQAVFAINLSLTRLSSFLQQMKIGRNGRAIIVDTQGRVVAGDRLLDVAARADWKFDKMTIDVQTQPVFTRALALFRVYGSGAKIIEGQDNRFVTIYASLDHIRPNWLLILDTPESDYAKIISLAGWQGFVFSLLIIALATGLALLLLRQKRRTLHAAHQLKVMHARQRRARALFGSLADDDTIFDASRQAPILSETIATLLNARRVALWRIFPRGDRLICEDAYDRETGQHHAGVEISSEEAKPIIYALQSNAVLQEAELANDKFFDPLWRADGHLGEQSQRTVYALIQRDGLRGLLLLHDADFTTPDAQFIPLLTDVVALRFAAIAQQERVHVQGAGVDAGQGLSGESDHDILPQSAARVMFIDTVRGEKPAGRYPMVAVGVIHFVHQDGPDPRATIELFEKLATRLEEVAETYALYAVQLAGNRVLLVGNCGADCDVRSVNAVADAMLDLRDTAHRVLSAENMVRNFNMGLDVGPVLGTHIGREGRHYALWGDAFAIADRIAMAASETGTIQVSEAAWYVLKQRFLFRPRGPFYMPGRGMTATYILAARQ